MAGTSKLFPAKGRVTDPQRPMSQPPSIEGVILIPKYYRSDQTEIHVTIPGVNLDNQSWDGMEGGDYLAEEVVFFPGGMKPQIALGGLPKRSNLTIKRQWSDVLINVFKQLDSLSGHGAVTASYVVLEPDQTSSGAVITYTGVLLGVARPNYESKTSEDAQLQLTVAVNGAIS